MSAAIPRNDAASVFRSLRSDCDFDRRAMKKSVPATRQSTYAAHSANGTSRCDSRTNIGAYAPVQSFGAA